MAALADFLGGQALLVSAHSNDVVGSYSSGAWSWLGYRRPRGIAISSDRIAVVGCQDLTEYDLTTSRSMRTMHIGDYGVHQIQYVTGVQGLGLVLTNPCNSGLATVNDRAELTPLWTAPWVSDGGKGGDYRTYINGLDYPYVTYLSVGDANGAFRADPSKGQLYNTTQLAATAKPSLTGLMMPHSPVQRSGALFVLDSGRRQLVKLTNNVATTVATFAGYARGLAMNSTYAFVGISQGRETGLAQVAADPTTAPGIAVVELATGKQVFFEPLDLREIFDVRLSPSPLKAV